jgi:NAD(P)-dependent dehydrogenase (short-subunit alcohol dehydrogenase family)
MDWSPDPAALRGRTAVVAGATRGAGRGIAAALGEAGATVVCTGRSSVTGAAHSDYERPETIEETAELVTSLGGTGVAIQVDHLEPSHVRRLADRIRVDHGHVDVLVNDIWGAEGLKADRPTGTLPSGGTISKRGCASCASVSRPIWSRRITSFRC